MATNDPEFRKFLDTLSTQSKLQTVETAALVKYQKEIAGEDDDKREKQLDQINETLKKILDALGSKGGKRKGKKGAVSSDGDDGEISLKDELKFLLGGAKKIGSGIKESVKGTFFTKPTTATPMSSAETLDAQDTINQPKQVEIDQLKIAEETNDTQKEILKELKKLNETTEEKGGGGGGGVDISVGGGDGGGKGKGKGSKIGRAMGALGKAARFAGPLAAAGVAAYEGVSGWGQAGENFDLKEGQEATLGQKASSALGGIASGLTFGLVDSKKAATGIHSFFGGGKKEDVAPAASPTTSDTKKSEAAPAASAPATKVGGAIAASAAPAKKASAGVSDTKGEENLEKLQMAEGELQGIYKDYKDEKAKVSEKLANDTKNYPEGFVDDPSDPEYPKELKAVDDKYKKLIEDKKKEIEGLSKAPGIKESKAREAKSDMDEEAPAKSKSTVTGETVSTTTTEQVSGGGSTTTKRVLSEDAKKAEAEMAGLDDKQAAERKQVVDTLKAEGKLTGRPKASDYESIPELKELKARQDQERGVLAKRVDEGTSIEVSKTSGENQAMRDEMATSKGGGQAIVSNNVTNTSTNNYMPIKADPRPNNRGSALDNYMGRVTAY